jgi:importin subunit beta-1
LKTSEYVFLLKCPAYNFQSTVLSDQFKPAILQCFGDIAQAIGGHFEPYLSVVGQVLDQAASVAPPEPTYEMAEYIISLREGIMDAWDGIILAMQAGNKSKFVDQASASNMTDQILAPYIPMVFRLLGIIYQDPNRSEALLRTCMGVLGDMSDAFPAGDYAQFFSEDWVLAMVKEVRSTREYEPRTLDTARWAREQVKRQISARQGQGLIQH